MPRNPWQLISNNRKGFFNPPTIELRTTEMPRLANFDLGYRYESCLFTSTDSDVMGRYNNLADAIAGHVALCKQYGLAP